MGKRQLAAVAGRLALHPYSDRYPWLFIMINTYRTEYHSINETSIQLLYVSNNGRKKTEIPSGVAQRWNQESSASWVLCKFM